VHNFEDYDWSIVENIACVGRLSINIGAALYGNLLKMIGWHLGWTSCTHRDRNACAATRGERKCRSADRIILSYESKWCTIMSSERLLGRVGSKVHAFDD
jgi:hypothetical protein